MIFILCGLLEAEGDEGSLGVFKEHLAFRIRPRVCATGLVGVEGGKLRIERVLGEEFGGDFLEVALVEQLLGGGEELGGIGGGVAHGFNITFPEEHFTEVRVNFALPGCN